MHELRADYVESDCRSNYSYFSTSAFLQSAFQLTALFNVPLSIFVLICILKATPKRMNNMRRVLLINHFCSVNLDLTVTILGCPFIFFPAAAGLPIGVFGETSIPTKWMFYWGQASISMIGLSIVILYENRQSQVSTIRFKISNDFTRIIFFGAIAVFFFLVLVPFYLDDTDQVELRKLFLMRVPCPTIEFYHPRTLILLKGGEFLPFLAITTTMGTITFLTSFYVIHTLAHLIYLSHTTESIANKVFQKKFFANVTIQVTIPFVAITVPILYSLYAEKNNYYNQAMNNFAMLALGSHGLIAMIATLCIYKPYRNFTAGIFRKRPEVSGPSISGQPPSSGLSKRVSVI